MKKRLLYLAIIPFFICNACSPSAEEMSAQSIADSTLLADSLAKVQAEQERLGDVSAEPSLANDISLKTKTPADKKLIKTAEIKFLVVNVWKSTEKIEDLTCRYEGYITYSNLQNKYEDYSSTNITRDSILVTREVVVENVIKLRIPNIKLDSFIRQLTPLVKYLDYRVIKMDDVTFQFSSIDKKGQRFKNYEKRQTSHIDSKNSKLKDASVAEDNLLERQMQADEIALKAKELEDQLKYCNLTIEIYQKSIITKEIKADFKYVSSSKPNFFVRAKDSIIQGYWILEEIIMFILKMWSILLIGFITFIGIKHFITLTKMK